MAKAFQCDRCFSYYTENKEVIPQGVSSDAIASGVQIVTKKGMVGNIYYDLCDDCLRKIVDFLENRTTTL